MVFVGVPTHPLPMPVAIRMLPSIEVVKLWLKVRVRGVRGRRQPVELVIGVDFMPLENPMPIQAARKTLLANDCIRCEHSWLTWVDVVGSIGVVIASLS
ncbi:hypothetical protein [Rhabdaerophilum sp. SD176]|uniref:hypothetical protein n=1 Tax=Rhabdaerophilum sp. SD176 TaxID=2983548 RepID=UPI0024DF961B|nr:hypothetical protein [Rhabdaerophilum sp. SD176]